MKPSNDPKADELRNKNLSEPSGTNYQMDTLEDQNGISEDYLARLRVKRGD